MSILPSLQWMTPKVSTQPQTSDGSSALDTYPYFLAFYLVVTVLFHRVFPKPVVVKDDKWKFHKYIDIVLGLFHANLSLGFACRAAWYCGLTFGEPNNIYSNLALAHSFGYFSTETIYSYFTDTMDGKTLFHHISVLTAFVMAVWSNISGTEICWAIIVTECSNPFMLVRNLMQLLGYKGTKWHMISSGIFVVTFVIARSYPGWWLVYYTWAARNNSIALKMAASCLLVVSHYWMLTMFRKVCKLASGCKKTILPPEGVNGQNIFWKLSLAGKKVQSDTTLRTVFISVLVYINIIHFFIETEGYDLSWALPRA